MKLTRRHLLKSTALLGGSFYLGFHLTGCSSDADYPSRRTGAVQPNAYLQITPNNEIILQIFRAEMGQGVTTGLTTLVGEELGIAPKLITLEFARFHPDFVDPEMMGMITGGSTTISHNHIKVRQAAANLRDISARLLPGAGGASSGSASLRGSQFGEKMHSRVCRWRI